MIEDYRKFIASRAVSGQRQGFQPKPINAMAKAHQVAALDFALNRGKSAAFLDTGLGWTSEKTSESCQTIHHPIISLDAGHFIHPLDFLFLGDADREPRPTGRICTTHRVWFCRD